MATAGEGQYERLDSPEITCARGFARAVAARGGRAYFVGGCVRDEILGRKTKDLDIEVHGVCREELERILSEFGTVMRVGESFGIYTLFGNDIDVALPRTEVCVGKGHRDFEVQVNPALGIKEAARRRDFTMNALYEIGGSLSIRSIGSDAAK